MRFYGRCGTCMDEQEVRGLETPEQVMTVSYAYWARHDHDPELMMMARERAADPSDPANIPDFIDEGDE